MLTVLLLLNQPAPQTPQEPNAVAEGSLVPQQGHTHYLFWKYNAKQQVPCGSMAALAAAPPPPCQCPANSDTWECVSDGLSFNQFLLRSFAAQPRYNSLQAIKALHLRWIIRGLSPAISVINLFLRGIVSFCIFEQCYFSIRYSFVAGKNGLSALQHL